MRVRKQTDSMLVLGFEYRFEEPKLFPVAFYACARGERALRRQSQVGQPEIGEHVRWCMTMLSLVLLSRCVGRAAEGWLEKE